MSRLRVAPIVEGHGEVASIRILLERVWEMVGGEYIDVLRPHRVPRGQLVKEEGIQDAVRVAIEMLNSSAASMGPGLVLVLADADEDCPAELGPKLREFARNVDARIDVACVLPNVEYETWFAASAESLSDYLELSPQTSASDQPEGARHGKGWIATRFRRTKQRPKYQETRDQPAMTSAMDLTLCRKRL